MLHNLTLFLLSFLFVCNLDVLVNEICARIISKKINEEALIHFGEDINHYISVVSGCKTFPELQFNIRNRLVSNIDTVKLFEGENNIPWYVRALSWNSINAIEYKVNIFELTTKTNLEKIYHDIESSPRDISQNKFLKFKRSLIRGYQEIRSGQLCTK